MKNLVVFFIALIATSQAFAGSYLCRSRTQNIVLKQSGESSLFLVYECDHSLTSCTSPMVFEKLGFEEEGSFSLHGQRANGQRASVTMVKSKSGWTASLGTAANKTLKDVLSCEPYRK